MVQNIVKRITRKEKLDIKEPEKTIKKTKEKQISVHSNEILF